MNKPDMVLLYNFLCYLLFSEDGVKHMVEICDTNKWHGLIMFPSEKKCKRITEWILDKTGIDIEYKRILRTYYHQRAQSGAPSPEPYGVQDLLI